MATYMFIDLHVNNDILLSITPISFSYQELTEAFLGTENRRKTFKTNSLLAALQFIKSIYEKNLKGYKEFKDIEKTLSESFKPFKSEIEIYLMDMKNENFI